MRVRHALEHAAAGEVRIDWRGRPCNGRRTCANTGFVPSKSPLVGSLGRHNGRGALGPGIGEAGAG